MERINIKLRRVYFLENGSQKRVALDLDFHGDEELREEFKSFILSNNLLPNATSIFLNAYVDNNFILLDMEQVALFFNHMSKLFKKYLLRITDTGEVQIQLTYLRGITYDITNDALYSNGYEANVGTEYTSENSEDIKEYVKQVISILKLFV
jgi:hypothetical protein